MVFSSGSGKRGLRALGEAKGRVRRRYEAAGRSACGASLWKSRCTAASSRARGCRGRAEAGGGAAAAPAAPSAAVETPSQ